MNLPETAKLQEIYGETEISGARFKNLADNFSKIYAQIVSFTDFLYFLIIHHILRLRKVLIRFRLL